MSWVANVDPSAYSGHHRAQGGFYTFWMIQWLLFFRHITVSAEDLSLFVKKTPKVPTGYSLKKRCKQQPSCEFLLKFMPLEYI